MIIDPQAHILYMTYSKWIYYDVKGFYYHLVPFDFSVIIVDFELPFLNVEFWQSELGEEIIKNGEFRW